MGLLLGPALFAVFYFIPAITGLDDAPRAVLAVTLWVASWWITEALPIPATSLMPIFLLPMTGGTDEETATMAYTNPLVFMYMGGFTIALAIQKWNLHRRIAMTVIRMVGSQGQRLMLGVILVWQDMRDLPWGILLLFGGGLSLAAAFDDSELTPWFGEVLGGLQVLPYVVIVVVLGAIVLFMTEIMSNTAVSNMLIPVSVGLGLAMGVDPLAIMAIVALTSTCAFMLPISTPPNAAVFSSDYLTMDDMVKAGFWMNIIALSLISVFVLLWQPVVLAS